MNYVCCFYAMRKASRGRRGEGGFSRRTEVGEVSGMEVVHVFFSSMGHHARDNDELHPEFCENQIWRTDVTRCKSRPPNFPPFRSPNNQHGHPHQYAPFRIKHVVSLISP